MKKSEKHNFTEEQITSFRMVFDSMDRNHNGTLNKNDFTAFLKKNKVDPKFVNATFKVFDENGDGLLSFDEYIRYLDACVRAEKEPRYIYKLIFEAVDEDHNGGLSMDEVQAFINLCGFEISNLKLAKEHRRIDTDKNHLISFDELCAALGI